MFTEKEREEREREREGGEGESEGRGRGDKIKKIATNNIVSLNGKQKRMLRTRTTIRSW